MAEKTAPTTLIRLPEVLRRTGMTRSSLYRAVSRGEFPRPVKLTERCTAWPDSIVDAWIQKRLTTSEAQGAPQPAA